MFKGHRQRQIRHDKKPIPSCKPSQGELLSRRLRALTRRIEESAAMYAPPIAKPLTGLHSALPRTALAPPSPKEKTLAIGPSEDSLEREADRAADWVVAKDAGRSQRSSFESSYRHPSHRPLLSQASTQQTTQRSPAGHARAGYASPAVHDVIRSSGAPLDAATRAFMEPRFGHNFSRIRIHADARAAESARSIDAQAYTVGSHIAFGAGSYAPSTPVGAQLLAHELAHTIQQRGQAHKVQRRRIPEAAELQSTLSPTSTDLAAHEAGLVRLLHNAWVEMPAADQTKVRTEAAKFGIAGPTEDLLFAKLAAGTRDQILRFAEEMRKVAPGTDFPGVTLGDPALIDTGPQNATDTANIAALVTGADTVFTAVAGTARDSDISDIFGATHVAEAKAKFAKAKTAMHSLQTANKIVTDRSGYNNEVGLGGLSNDQRISLSPRVIDHPNDPGSKETMVHESMHAGNPGDVLDKGYLSETTFPQMPEDKKLHNAADFEVVAWRVLDSTGQSAFAGQKFVPPGTSATPGGPATAPPTQRQDAITAASDAYRGAWTTAVRLHPLFVRELKSPAEWNTLDLHPEFGVAAGTHFSDCLPFWSKIENMTIHKRTGINPGGGKPAAPVTQIDIAQSESVVRKLRLGMAAVDVPEPEIVTLESKATPAQKANIAKSAADEANVIVSLARSKVGEITGPVARDERVVDRLSQAFQQPSFAKEALIPRNPASFPD